MIKDIDIFGKMIISGWRKMIISKNDNLVSCAKGSEFRGRFRDLELVGVGCSRFSSLT